MIPNRAEVWSRSVLRHLSIATVIVVATSTLSTQSFAVGTPEQRAACTSDAIRLCMSVVHSESGLFACMTRNKVNLSERCRATLSKRPS
jgi:hypothetical protein